MNGGARRVARVSTIIALATLLSACATMGIGSFTERGIDFSRYRTYAWAVDGPFSTGDARLDNNEVFRSGLQRAVDRRLSERGLERASAEQADLRLHYHARVEQRLDAGGPDDVEACPRCAPIVYDAGTLVLDLVDARTNTLVWRGWAEDGVDGVIDDQWALDRKVEEAVTRMLARLPALGGK